MNVSMCLCTVNSLCTECLKYEVRIVIVFFVLFLNFWMRDVDFPAYKFMHGLNLSSRGFLFPRVFRWKRKHIETHLCNRIAAYQYAHTTKKRNKKKMTNIMCVHCTVRSARGEHRIHVMILNCTHNI